MKNKVIALVGTKGVFPLQSCFKNVETNEITTKIPENQIFEITNSGPKSESKSGRENRRERRKQNRKKK